MLWELVDHAVQRSRIQKMWAVNSTIISAYALAFRTIRWPRLHATLDGKVCSDFEAFVSQLQSHRLIFCLAVLWGSALQPSLHFFFASDFLSISAYKGWESNQRARTQSQVSLSFHIVLCLSAILTEILVSSSFQVSIFITRGNMLPQRSEVQSEGSLPLGPWSSTTSLSHKV